MMYAGHCRQFDADVQYDVQLQTHRPSDTFKTTEWPRLLHAVSNVQPSGIIVVAGIGEWADVVGCVVVAGGDAVSGAKAVGASVVAEGTAVGFMVAGVIVSGFIVTGLILAGDEDGDTDSDTDVESDVVSDAESSSEAEDDSEAVNVYVAVAVSVPGVALVE